MSEKRNLELTPRVVNQRDKKPIQLIKFELGEVQQHFVENIASLTSQFEIADNLVSGGNFDAAKDIWRSQIVFLESALDFYIHEITKYGMRKIFNEEWNETEKYGNHNLKLSSVICAIKTPEDTSWFFESVNESYSKDTFMDFESIKQQMNLVGINLQHIADKAFFVQGSSDRTLDQLKAAVNELFNRRNAIAHQSDRNHRTADRNDINKEYVEKSIETIRKIVDAIDACIDDKNQQV